MKKLLILITGISGSVFLGISSLFYILVGFKIIMVEAYNVNLIDLSGGISFTPGGYELVGNPKYSLPVILSVTAIIVFIIAAVIFSVVFIKTGKTSMFCISIFGTLTALFIYFLLSYETVYFANFLLYRFFFGFNIVNLFELLQPVLLPQIVFSLIGMNVLASSFILKKMWMMM